MASQKKGTQEEGKDDWKTKVDEVMANLDEVMLRQWTYVMEDSRWLLGSMPPATAILKRLKLEKKIRENDALFTQDKKVVQCGRCQFRNPMDRYRYDPSCLICRNGLDEKSTRVNNHERRYDYDSWVCKYGHMDRMNEWFCRGSKEKGCAEHMHDAESVGIL